MNILIVGGGPASGASCMRAEQLGGAIGARVHIDPWHDPNPIEFDRADFVIIVKRLKKRWKRWIARVQSSRKPIVWDAVDFWQQPEENNIDRSQAIKSFWRRKGELGAVFVIAATRQMAKDCSAVYLPHHHRVGLAAGPVRRAVQTVGYEGNENYLGIWRKAIERECAQRGWRFVVNPTSLTDVDIVVAFRDGEWDGATCRAWKSGVKYANSIAAARPVITQPCAAFDEIAPPGTTIEGTDQLGPAFDEWTPYDVRSAAERRCVELTPKYHLETIAAKYSAILDAHMRDRKFRYK